mmetsp:Transcript_15826/g.34240  ORF Transcript_15826/g.34240 Transcript_15826/m.34240 type:complete len:217 (-) Transcript_15826:777-1427(-)
MHGLDIVINANRPRGRLRVMESHAADSHVVAVKDRKCDSSVPARLRFAPDVDVLHVHILGTKNSQSGVSRKLVILDENLLDEKTFDIIDPNRPEGGTHGHVPHLDVLMLRLRAASSPPHSVVAPAALHTIDVHIVQRDARGAQLLKHHGVLSPDSARFDLHIVCSLLEHYSAFSKPGSRQVVLSARVDASMRRAGRLHARPGHVRAPTLHVKVRHA